MRLLFTLIGYLATATVLSAALGLGFLWQTERLDDEKTFQIIALLHGVNLDEVGAQTDPIDEQDTPPEERSLEETRALQQVALRDFEVKEALLKRNRSEFEYWYEEFKDERGKLDRIAEQLNKQLSEEGDEEAQERIDNVVRNLESLVADVAKDQLRRTLKAEENGIETVINLLNAMDERKKQKILKSFAGEEELEDLHVILTEMRKGGARKDLFDSYRDELDSVGAN